MYVNHILSGSSGRRLASGLLSPHGAMCLAMLMTFGGVAVADEPGASSPEPRPSQESAADEDSTESGPRRLSVAPLNEITYPDDRPEWIDAPPTFGEVVDVWPVQSRLHPTLDEARESLRVQVEGAAAAYAEQFLGEKRAGRLDDSVRLAPDIEALPDEDRYMGPATLGDQQVYEAAVRLHFDEAYRQRLAGQWQQAEVGHRLSLLAIAGGGSVCLLITGGGLVRRLAHRRAIPRA